MALHSIELCAGTGMLGEGFRAACGLSGVRHRTVCYVEREASAAAQLVALMEAGALDAAPVWSDLRTFDGAPWRTRVDCVIAGFPCQDLSVAGRRAGLDGDRSGLFFEVLRVARDSGAWLLVLENVAGIVSATATVVDEAEGELGERAAARILGELADSGWDAEWLHLRAHEVGASHQRERWFCLAWRDDGCGHMGDADRARLQGWRDDARERRGERTAGPSGADDFFAPGPLDARWPGIVSARPDLAPAAEPGVRLLADGLAGVVDESRARQLRQTGNGAVALQAAVAFVELVRRAGLGL